MTCFKDNNLKSNSLENLSCHLLSLRYNRSCNLCFFFVFFFSFPLFYLSFGKVNIASIVGVLSLFNKVTSLKRKGIKKFSSNATSNAKHPGEFWQKMKPLLPNSSLSKQNSVTLVEDGKVLTDPSEVVEVFNNYFASVAVHETHRGRVENFSDHPSVLGIASRQVLEHPFTFEPVSSSYVKEISR